MTFHLIRDGSALQRLVDGRRTRVASEPLHRTVRASKASQRPIMRLRSLPWWDAITGGGFVRGAVYLFHGEPGAGKSTALAQAAGSIAGSIYVSAEEEVSAVASRFRRLGVDGELFCSSSVPDILGTIRAAPFAVVDSIQMMDGDMLTVTKRIVEHARVFDTCFVLVCHETKGGVHAGPRKLEHLIDCSIKLLREPRWIHCEKNRFGPTGGLPLIMTESGLHFSG